jgi:hypothetical protein
MVYQKGIIVLGKWTQAAVDDKIIDGYAGWLETKMIAVHQAEAYSKAWRCGICH